MKKTLALLTLIFASHAYSAETRVFRDADGHYEVSFRPALVEGSFQMIGKIYDRRARKTLSKFDVFPYIKQKAALKDTATIQAETSPDFDIVNSLFSEDGTNFAVAASDMVKVYDTVSGKFLFGVTSRRFVLKSGERITKENNVDRLCLVGEGLNCSTVDLSEVRTNQNADNEWTQTSLTNFSVKDGIALLQFEGNSGLPNFAVIPMSAPENGSVR